VITPSKGSFQGPAFTTDSITCVIDGDGNLLNDQWEIENFGSTSIDPMDDPDSDGLPNQSEYLFGLDPNNSNSNSIIQSTLDPVTGEFSYSRPANDIQGVSYKVWTSEDLINWTERTVVETPTNNNGKSKTVVANVGSDLVAQNSKLFIRVGAEW